MATDPNLNHCFDDGYCVSTSEWLPAEPFDFYCVPWGPTVGCNRLRCGTCKADVRSLPGYELPLDPRATEAEVYALVGARDVSQLVAAPGCRIYSCPCFKSMARTYFRTSPEHDFAPYTPWHCGGHPRLSVPATLEGVAVSEQANWAELARQSFAGSLGVSLHPNVDRVPGFWLQRLYSLLVELPFAAEIPKAAADAVLDPDPRVRRGAIGFFQCAWDATGAEKMAPALRDHPELFVDVRVEGDPSTLEHRLLELLSTRIVQGASDTAAIELLRAALARSFESLDLGVWLHVLARADQGWLLDHGEQLVAKRPELWRNLRNALEAAGASHRKLRELVKRVGVARR